MSDSALDRLVRAIGPQFEVEGELGRGGMSIVYRAQDLRLRRPVAIKVLPPELAHDPAVRTRFSREAHTAAQLSHPHIVPIFDLGERDGIPYLIMAFVTGGNLAGLLARDPRPPLDDVRRLLAEVADALDYAHQRGVIHRDIKPDNVLIDRDTGRALVTDFGIARALEAGGRLTRTGIAVGTPTYMSPEQATGESGVDGRSDIYSLGVVAYQMLTGRVPFSASNNMALLLKHVTDTPRPIADLRSDAPRALCETIERALAKSPDDRWPSAAAMREALISDEVPVSSWRQRREPVRYVSPGPDASRRVRTVRDHSRSESPGASPSPALAATPGGTVIRGRDGKPIILEPAHLAGLTQSERDDLRLWHGHVQLLDRIKAIRGYLLETAAALAAGFGILVVIVEEADAFPLFASWAIPALMVTKLIQRAKSLRRAGLKLRRVFLMPRATWVLPAAALPPDEKRERRTPVDVPDGPFAQAIRRAAVDRTTIKEIVAGLPAEDRAMLPDLAPTVDALYERVRHLAAMIERLDDSIDPHAAAELQARAEAIEREPESAERERRLAMVQRQRATLDEMLQHRATLVRQLESAGLALGTLRLDLIKLRSSGLPSALADVSTATQEARALSLDIGAVLDAVAEAKNP